MYPVGLDRWDKPVNYVAQIEVGEAELLGWGAKFEVVDTNDVPAQMCVFSLRSGAVVALARFEGVKVPGFSLFCQAEYPIGDALHDFLDDSGLFEGSVSRRSDM